jgi:hypothetical protein
MKAGLNFKSIKIVENEATNQRIIWEYLKILKIISKRKP